MKTTSFIFAAALLTTIGCQNDIESKGQATYARPSADGGKPVSKQSRGDFQLKITLSGDAAWDLVSGVVCSLTSGGAEGNVEASGSVKGDGSYAAAAAIAEGSFTSSDDVLCGDIQNVQFDSLVNVQLQGSIPANEENCNDFCQASAEADCQGSIDEASCIADAKASCDTECAQSQKITGSGQISAEALSQLNGDLSGSGKINADVDIVFTTLE